MVLYLRPTLSQHSFLEDGGLEPIVAKRFAGAQKHFYNDTTLTQYTDDYADFGFIEKLVVNVPGVVAVLFTVLLLVWLLFL